jgi:squalene-hopene/tetraprenyl-beta-curcumene cyclase
MKERSRATRLLVGASLAGMLAIPALGPSQSLPAQEAKAAKEPAKPPSSSPAEPLVPSASMQRAAAFLDQVAVSWTRQHKCGSCHTNYPYLVARPVLKEPAGGAMAEVRHFFEERVAHWDDKEKGAKPKWDAEVVSTATALAMNDAATTGKLHPRTRQALDRIWTVQKPNGGFDWLKCGWPPYEDDDYYGALVAAIGAGHARDDYAQTPAAQAGLKRLRAYFANNHSPNLHHQVWLLWASTRLDDLMTAEQRMATISRLRELQRADGGWNLPSLGGWKRRDGTPNDPRAPSDGYATGLVIFVLRQTGVPAADPALRRGVTWLLANQRASGRWFTRSLNDDEDHYITHAGTAFAVLALQACGAPADQTAQHQPIRSDQPRTVN